MTRRRILVLLGVALLAVALVTTASRTWVLWSMTGSMYPEASYLTSWGCNWDVRTRLNADYEKAKRRENTQETVEFPGGRFVLSYGAVEREGDLVRQTYRSPSSASDQYAVYRYACFPDTIDPGGPKGK